MVGSKGKPRKLFGDCLKHVETLGDPALTEGEKKKPVSSGLLGPDLGCTEYHASDSSGFSLHLSFLRV